MSIPKKGEFSPQNYIWEWDRKAYPFYVYGFANQWLNSNLSKPVYSLFIYKNEKVNCYINKASLNIAAKDILLKVAKDNLYFGKFVKYIYKTGEDLHRFCAGLEKTRLSGKSVKELQDLLSEAYWIYAGHTRGVGVIRNTNRLLQKKLVDFYKSEEVVASLFSTNKKSFFIKEHEELLKIAKRAGREKTKKEEIEKALNEHAKKYFYLLFGYHGRNILTKNDFKKRLDDVLANKENPDGLRRNLKKENQKRSKLLAKLNPDARMRRLIEFGSTCTFFKDYIRGNLGRLHYNIYRLSLELGKRTGRHWTEIASILPDKNGYIDLADKAVSGQAVIYSDKNGIGAATGKRAEKLISSFEKKFKADRVDIIKGTGASSGLAKGKIKIAGGSKRISGSGFILAAPMTTPDLMPLIKRAKAIITDEGGLTCHAAIISRELGVPCVIGAKIATKILKDGDLVEVDANKGIIKIIKKVK